MAYIERLSGNQIARKVKLADLEHNSDLTRLIEVTERDLRRQEKYFFAKEFLLRQEGYIKTSKNENKFHQNSGLKCRSFIDVK